MNLREQRTALHHRLGIFGYCLALQSVGVTLPSEQMVLVARFVERVLGQMTEFPDLADDQAFRQWMAVMVQGALPQIRPPDWTAEPLQTLFSRAGQIIDWDPYREFAEILSVACGPTAYESALRRLARQGFPPWQLDLLGLAENFVQSRLPQALQTFDLQRGAGKEAAWLERVFYRFALRLLLSDRTHRHHLHLVEAVEAFPDSTTPETLLLRREENLHLTQLQVELDRLPSREQTAVRLYFGFSPGRERTLSEIAGELGCSEYLARTAVVRGLAMLTARLNAPGPFTPNEFELLKLLFLEGLELGPAAERLSLHLNDARKMAAEVGRKLRRVLRARTGCREIQEHRQC